MNPYDSPAETATVPPLPPPALPQVWHQAPGAITNDDKTLGMLAHLLGIFTGFLGPLVIYLVKKDSSPYAKHHAQEALNFQITMLLVMMALGSVTVILMLVFIGFFLIPVIFVVQILAIIAEVMAAIAANKGEWHRYPFNLRLV